MRRRTYTDAIQKHFSLGKDLNQRDTIAVKRTVSGSGIREELKEAINYMKANLSRISQSVHYSDFEIHLKGSDLNGVGNVFGLELAIFISLVSGILEKPLLPQMIVPGSMSIGGAIIGAQNLGDVLQIAADSGAKKILLPASDMTKMATVPPDLFAKFNLMM